MADVCLLSDFFKFFLYLSIKVNFERRQGKVFIAIYSNNIYQAFTIQFEPRGFFYRTWGNTLNMHAIVA